ncbi:FAD:protein FMN transferase [Halothiobacillus sp. DCM-1]|uniref:FAD:protein FMN transferase n=1 Tax=Halothiobacillus sp. DCM-1 TaxID=3112558 RepID=UPI003245DDAE
MTRKPTLERLRPALGTFVRINASADSRAQLERALAAAFTEIEAVEARLSLFRPDSDLSRINQRRDAVSVHPQTLRILRLACRMAEQSQHRFNPTVGGALVARGRLPDQGGDLLPVGCAADILIHGTTVSLRRPMYLTLDGIAKGWAVDRAIATLRAHGVREATVNAGGDWRCIGRSEAITRPHPDGTLWLGRLSQGACATSAAGLDPKRFPALLMADDQPVSHGVWTVIAPTAWQADALTKVAAAGADAADWVARCGGQLLAAEGILPHAA